MAFDASSPEAKALVEPPAKPKIEAQVEVASNHISITVPTEITAVLKNMREQIEQRRLVELIYQTTIPHEAKIPFERHAPDPRLTRCFRPTTAESRVMLRAINYLRTSKHWIKGHVALGDARCLSGAIRLEGGASRRVEDELLLIAGRVATQRFGNPGRPWTTGILFNDSHQTTHNMLLTVMLDVYEEVGGKFDEEVSAPNVKYRPPSRAPGPHIIWDDLHGLP